MQADATFCGQCGFNLQAESLSTPQEETVFGTAPDMPLEETSLPDEIPMSVGEPNIMPETSVSLPIESPWDEQEQEETTGQSELSEGYAEVEPTQNAFNADLDSPETEFAEAIPSNLDESAMPFPEGIELESEPPETSEGIESSFMSESESEESELTPEIGLAAGAMASATQLQLQKASLLHLQSNTTIEIPNHLDVVHFGKPNGQIPPDIDVSGFADSEVVSRVHADIRIEGDVFYIEDTGSSNGTYINHAPLQKGNRHRLRTGDRIALGKGDLVTFIFQLN